MKRSLKQGSLVVISSAILKNQKHTDFFCHNHNTIIAESDNARFIENGQTSGSGEPCKVDVQETRVETLTPNVSPLVIVPLIVPGFCNMLEQ